MNIFVLDLDPKKAAQMHRNHHLNSYGPGLLDEYTLRYGKKHASGLVFEQYKTHLSDLNYSKSGLTEFAQAMHEYCKSKDYCDSLS